MYQIRIACFESRIVINTQMGNKAVTIKFNKARTTRLLKVITRESSYATQSNILEFMLQIGPS